MCRRRVSRSVTDISTYLQIERIYRHFDKKCLLYFVFGVRLTSWDVM